MASDYPASTSRSAGEFADRETGTEIPFPIEMLPPTALRASPRNARTHSKEQIRGVANSILRFGFNTPIIVDHRGQIVAGHARAAAAKLLDLRRVPVRRVSHLNEAELRAYALADNKLADNAGYDREKLAAELQGLQIVLPENDLDLAITGFNPGEVDSILADFGEDRPNPADEIPNLEKVAVARKGDLFCLGQHRLIAGDAREARTFERVMKSKTATMAFLDPPYNVEINGHVGGRGRIKHREFACASGEMTSEQFTEFLQKTLAHCARHTIDGGITYVCIDWRHASELLTAGATVFEELKNICVWAKTTPGQGSFYRSQHELVFVYKRGHAPHINTFELGQHGRSRSNVWSYAGVNTFRAGRMDELKMHPTVKPVALIADAMKDCSQRGSIVLDVFAGSGSSILAAEQVGRRAFCIEIDPRYVDLAIRRWQRATGKDAILESTGHRRRARSARGCLKVTLNAAEGSNQAGHCRCVRKNHPGGNPKITRWAGAARRKPPAGDLAKVETQKGGQRARKDWRQFSTRPCSRKSRSTRRAECVGSRSGKPS